jgi:hypothetical protein
MGILSSLLGFGESRPAMAPTGTIIQTSELAKEIAPYMKEMLEKGKALYDLRTTEGYQEYPDKTMAELTSEQQQAMTGLSGLVGTTKPVYDEAAGLMRGTTEKFTPTTAEEYMSPYQQAVVDVEKREAQQQFEQNVLPKLQAEQVAQGAFGGSRGAMMEAQALSEQQRFLGDIQTRGSQSAYRDAIRGFEAQKSRESAAAAGLSGLAPAQLKASAYELGALQTVGEQKQQRAQQQLDEDYKRFLEQRSYPEKQLGQFQSVIAGFPSASSISRTERQLAPQPSTASQFLGGLSNLATTAGNIYGAFGGFGGGFGGGGRATGGQVGLPISYRQAGGSTGVQPQFLPPREPQYGGRGLPSAPIPQVPQVVPAPQVPQVVPEVGPQVQQAPALTDLEIANQSALAAGQPQFNFNGMQFQANPNGPPIEIPTPTEPTQSPLGIGPSMQMTAPTVAMKTGGSLPTIYRQGGLRINNQNQPQVAATNAIDPSLIEEYNKYRQSLIEGQVHPYGLESFRVRKALDEYQQGAEERKRLISENITGRETRAGEAQQARKREAIIAALQGFGEGITSPEAAQRGSFLGELGVGLKGSAQATTPLAKEARIKKAEEAQAIDDLRLEAALEWDKGNLEHATALYDLATKQEEMSINRATAEAAKMAAGMDYQSKVATIMENIRSSIGDATTGPQASYGLLLNQKNLLEPHIYDNFLLAISEKDPAWVPSDPDDASRLGKIKQSTGWTD